MAFHEILHLSILENLWRKFKFLENLTKLTGTLHEDQCTFLITFRSFLLRMRNISSKSCTEIETNILHSITFFLNRAVYDIMLQNTAEADRPQITTWRICIACWIPKSTNRHSKYVTLIAFPMQLWLHESVSMLRYRYIACHVYSLCFPDGAAIPPVCVLCVGQI